MKNWRVSDVMRDIRARGASRFGYGRALAVVVALAALVALAPRASLAGTLQFADPVVELFEAASAQIAVVRTGDTTGPASVLLEAKVGDGSAALGADYTIDLPTGVVEFAAGEFVKIVNVSTLRDPAAPAEGTEYARLALRAPTGATLGAQSELQLFVRDLATADAYFDFVGHVANVGATTVATAVTVVEGDAVTLEVGHSPAVAGAVDVTVAGGSATLGVDYADPTATLSFAAGSAATTFDIRTLQDSVTEGTQTIELLLRNTAQGGVVRLFRALVFVQDDEAGQAGQFGLVPPDRLVGVKEGQGPVTLRVQRSGGTSGVAAVDYVTFTPQPSYGNGQIDKKGTLVFADGVTEQTISVDILNDQVWQPRDHFRVVLVNPTGGATLDPRASSITVSIVEDEPLCDNSGNCPSTSDGNDGGGCFIATAAYGSYLDPHVVTLRGFRDRYLLTNGPGRAFVAWYYRESPPFAELIRQRPWMRVTARILLTPLVLSVAYPVVALTLLLAALGAGAIRWRRGRSPVCAAGARE